MDYKELFRDHSPYLGYGFFHYFFSGLGQTFLIAQFVPHFTQSLGIDNAFFGTLYAAATLLSAFLLPWAGSLIDRFRIRYLSTANAFALAAFCALTAYSTNPYLLFVALFGLRFTGQGFMVLIGSTALARYFRKARGKAVSMGSLGLSLSEMIMPSIVVLAIAGFGWRNSWLFLGGALLILFLPLIRFLVHKKSPFQKAPDKYAEGATEADATRGQVLRDPVFWLLVPAALFVPFFITGFFIHQNLVAAGKGWDVEWLGTCFIAYGAARILAYFMVGPLIDRFKARRVFLFINLPLMVGLLFLLGVDHEYGGLAYMFFAGITGSLAAACNTALWAEVYGSSHLGSIKGSVSTLMVFLTSLGALAMEPLLGGEGEGLEFTILLMSGVILFLFLLAVGTVRYIERKRVLPEKLL